MTNDQPTDDDRVEPDGGIVEAAGGADETVDAETETEVEDQPDRSLTDLPLSRRTTVALMAATGTTALASGSASATDAEAAPAGQDAIAPGDSDRALDFALSSSDSVLDANGGTISPNGSLGAVADEEGADGRLDDGEVDTTASALDAPPTTGSDETLYDTVTNGLTGSPYRHPQPDPEQETIPGDLLSEFSVFDRVFTDAYASYSDGDGSIFNRDADSLYQAAGKINSVEGEQGATPQEITPYVEEFVPFGYTASDGDGDGCVDLSDDSTPQSTGDDTSNYNAAVPTGENNFSTDISEVINPQFAVKVDSIGIGQDEVTANASTPITAQDVLGGSASPETILVDDSGSVPDAFADSDNERPNGFEVAYDGNASAGDVTVSFNDHRRLITLDNAGWLSGVDSCPRPRGDLSPCDDFKSAGPGNPITESYDGSDTAYGRGNVTAGLRDVSQLGLDRDFERESDGNTESPDQFVAVGQAPDDFIDDRQGLARQGVAGAVNPDGRAHILADAYYEDEDDLEGTTTALDATSVFDAPDMTGVELTLLNAAGASDQLARVDSELARNTADNYGVNGSTGTDDGTYGEVYSTTNGFVQLPLDTNVAINFDIEPGDPLRRGQSTDSPYLLARGRATPNEVDTNVEDGNDGVLTESEAFRELEFVEANLAASVNVADMDIGSSDGAAAFIDSENDFTVPVQLHVEAAFRCESNNELRGSPLGQLLSLSENSELQSEINGDGNATVDVTQSDRVTFAVTSGNSTVTEDGVFIPSSNDAGSTATVDAFFDGESVTGETGVDIAVESGDAASISDITVDGLVDLRNDTTGGSVLDPLPTGEPLQAAVVGTLEVDGATYTVDLTHLVDSSGNNPTVFDDEDDDFATPDPTPYDVDGTATASGLINAGTPSDPIAGTGVDNTEAITATVNGIDAAGSTLDAGSTSSDYQVEAQYFLPAVARPSRTNPETYNPSNGTAGGMDPGIPNDNTTPGYVFASGDSGATQDVVLINTVERPYTSNVVDADLDSPDEIVDTLEANINDQTRDSVSVSAFFNPDGHSASGYVVVSDTEVESSFDQNVDVSSVEIEEFTPVFKGDGPAPAVVDETNFDFDPYDQLYSPETAADEYLERQDIAQALGFGGPFNTVDAATVQNDAGGFVEPSLTASADGVPADRYAARGDPLDQVDDASINRFLGDNELTCNDLELFATTELIGAEDPGVTTPLHDPTVTNTYEVKQATRGTSQHTGTYSKSGPRPAIDANPRVLTYYDSETQLVLESADFDRFPVAADGVGDWPLTATVRPGGPNVNEGDLRGLVHNEDDLYTAIEGSSTGAFGSVAGEYPRARIRMLEPGTSSDIRAIQLPSLPGSGSRTIDLPGGTGNEAPLPFYEGFDILEVGDTIATDETEFVPESEDVPPTLIDDDGRQLTPRETAAQGFYGNRFEGLAVANDGSIDVTSIVDDDTLEHSLVISGVGENEDDVSDGAEVRAFEGTRDPESDAPFLRAAQRLTGFGQAGEPVFPRNAPAVIPFRRPENIESGDGFGALDGEPVTIPAFTDDSANREIYFGEGISDDDYPNLGRETTCGTAVTDGVIFGVDVSLSNQAPEGESLRYGVPPLYDFNSDGEYDEGDTTENQDRGVFVESHDDTGDVFPDDADIVIGVDPGSGTDLQQYENEEGVVGINGVSQAISDWQNGDLSITEVSQVIGAWQSGTGV